MADPRIADAWERLPDYLGNHVLVCVISLALGLAISIPLALYCRKRPTLRAAALGVTSVVQTIPGLALLALFYPVLLALAALSERFLGVSFSALGLLPSVLALTLYSMLPVLRNTIAGLDAIDPAIKEAAVGAGMTPRQSLTMVEWPLALPIIMAGIRTAAVWVIGAATLSTPIGQTSLGNYIFTGLQTQNWVFVLFGCAAAALLAIAVDQFLGLIESGVTRRRKSRKIAGMAGLAIVAALPLLGVSRWKTDAYVIGAKPFAEQYILAALMRERLAANRLPAIQKESLGSAVIFDALVQGDVDVYVDYTGTLWANQMRRSDVLPRNEVYEEVSRWAKETYGVKVLGRLGFENAYTLAMEKTLAASLGVASDTELSRVATGLSIAGDYEFFGRPEWSALRETYGLDFRAQRQMQSEFMYAAAAAREVDVIAAYTSDGRISEYGLVTLVDDRHAIPPYDAIVMVSPKRAGDAALTDALRPLLGAIDIELMREANRRIAADKAATSDTIAQWLWSQISKRGR